MGDGKHMLINSPEGAFTVPLLAKDNSYQISFSGYKRSYTASIERMFVYELYVNEKKGNVISWLREVDKFNVTPMVYDEFIRLFEQEHPKTFVDSYSWEEIPMQADDKYGLDLPIPFHCCTISRKHEEEIMQIIKIAGANTRKQVSDYFRRFCEEYGYDFSRKCKGKEFYWLYEAFLEQHGINMLYRPQNNVDTNTLSQDEIDNDKIQNKNWAMKIIACLCSVCMLVLLVVLYSIGFWPVCRILNYAVSPDDYSFFAIIWIVVWIVILFVINIFIFRSVNQKYQYDKDLCNQAAHKIQERNIKSLKSNVGCLIVLAIPLMVFLSGGAAMYWLDSSEHPTLWFICATIFFSLMGLILVGFEKMIKR